MPSSPLCPYRLGQLKLLLAVCASSAVFATGACVRPRDPLAPLVGERRTDFTLEMNRVLLLDERLREALLVERSGGRRSQTNTIEVYATLRSRLNEPSRIIARARFFDASQRPLDVTQWTTLFLERRGLADYTALSTSPEAAAFIVEIQVTR